MENLSPLVLRESSRFLLHWRRDTSLDTFSNTIVHPDRCSNPLDPSYMHHGDIVTDEPGAHYIPKYHERRGAGASAAPFLPLTTSDIDGAHIGSSSESRIGYAPIEGRRGFAVTNFLGDIAGAHPGSHRSGLPERSVVTDPNTRDYLLLDGTRSSQVYAAGGIGQSAYLASAAEAAADVPAAEGGVTGGAVRRRVRVDPRDTEIMSLRHQVEQLVSAAKVASRKDPFLDIVENEGAGAGSHLVSPALSLPAIVASAAPPAASLPPPPQAAERSSAKTSFAASDPGSSLSRDAASLSSRVASDSLSSRVASSSQPLSPRNQSSSEPECAPSDIWPLKDSKTSRPKGRSTSGSVRQAAVASITSIATGHAASSDAAPVKFSQMSKAMVLAKKSSGPAVLALPPAGASGLGGAYAAGLSMRLTTMARAAEIAAVRGLPG